MGRPVAQDSSQAAYRDGRGESRVGDNLIGAGWMIASCVAATGMSVGVRTLSEHLEAPMIAFLRCLLGLWILAPMLLDGTLPGVRLTRPWLHLLRGVLMGGALNFGYFALGALELTTATLLFFLAPVFATVLAGPILGERVGAPRWAAVGAGFLGAILILRPGAAPLEAGAVAAVASALCFAVSLMMSRIIGREDGPRAVMVTSTVVATLISLPPALLVWRLPDSLTLWGWITFLVLASSARMYADIAAYTRGEAGFIAPFSYLRLLLVGLAGWLLFSEIPDEWEALGGSVIVLSTLVIAYRERRAGRAVSDGAPGPGP